MYTYMYLSFFYYIILVELRGYYVRCKAINNQVIKFLELYFQSQIISLGAGFDTLYFRLFDQLISANTRVFEVCRYLYIVPYRIIMKNFFQVDFPAVISRKSHLINSSQKLSSMLSPLVKSVSPNIMQYGNYHMIACDITQTERLSELLSLCKLQYDVPTLFISECVLTYIDPYK